MVKAINRMKEEFFEEVKDIPYKLPERWRWVKLEDIVEINPESVNPVRDFGEGTFTYIDISSVENYTGRIINPKTIVAKKAPSRARRLIKHRDILLSTVRPYLMAHAFVSSEYENQVCSTGFAVLRVKNEKQVCPEYLWFSLFSEALLKQYERLMMGASYPALNNNQVKALVIPLPFKNGEPDFEKQKQIVERIEALFKEIDKAIELRQKAIEETKKLFDSVLDRIFREAEDRENWKWIRLGDIAEKIKAGGTPSRKVKKYWENGTIPWIKIQDIDDHLLYIYSSTEFITEEGLRNSSATLFKKGTVLFSIFASIGKVGILNIDAATNQAIVGIVPKKEIDNKYLAYVLKFESKKLTGRGNTQKNINQKFLKNLLIPIPCKDEKVDLERQKQIAEYLDNLSNKIKQLEELERIQLEKFRQLKESILNKAFRGELI